MAGYNKKAEPAHPKAESHQHDEGHFREKHLMLDPLPRGQMNDMVMESMYETSWKFWVVFAILSVIVAYGLFFSWGGSIARLIGVSSSSIPCSGSVSATRERSFPPFFVCSKLNSAARSHAPLN
ncbi:hypothetical protein [Candidatus Villigracilis saccharophilus]|uniref:hypothetical protein n=1 Tax=Candidatus Villigracilis saccharophilus TaxID=3140684 RepID=UPI003135D04B|nr:hypothetical protein [Anaerolineales bacterium]